MDARVNEIWTLVYDSFEKRPGDALRSLYAHKGTANDLQFELGKKVAQLKRNGPDDQLIGAIRADVLIAEATSFITEESSRKILKLLEEI